MRPSRTDIVERLRATAGRYDGFDEIQLEAADEIEQLRIEIERLRQLQEPNK